MAHDYFKDYRKAKTCKDRAKAISMWYHREMIKIGRMSSLVSRKVLQDLIAKTDADANRFCGRDFVEGWTLCEGWWRSTLAQVRNDSVTNALFDHLGWDFEYSSNPTPTEEISIEYMEIIEISGSYPIKLMVRSTSQIRLGSIWLNKRSGKRWKVLSFENNLLELELVDDENMNLRGYTPGFAHNIYRTHSQLTKKLEKVAV